MFKGRRLVDHLHIKGDFLLGFLSESLDSRLRDICLELSEFGLKISFNIVNNLHSLLRLARLYLHW